jgi:hypothetical protein
MTKRDLIVKWITALRSGKYKQGRYILRTTDNSEFCCLGVACEIHPDFDLNNEWCAMYSLPPEHIMQEYGIAFKQHVSLINTVRGQYGLIMEQPSLASFLVHLNDNVGYDFKEIADWIECYLLPLVAEE